MRYISTTLVTATAIQVALDKHFGYRNAAGVATPRQRMVRKGSVVAPALAFGCVTEIEQPGWKYPLIDGGDGNAAIELADVEPNVDALMGRTTQGVAMPAVASFVAVTRARNHSLLPNSVRDKLDDRWAADKTDAEIDAELQGRAAAVRGRKAVSMALGIGRT